MAAGVTSQSLELFVPESHLAKLSRFQRLDSGLRDFSRERGGTVPLPSFDGVEEKLKQRAKIAEWGAVLERRLS
jgi:hypothetical protein